MFELYITEISIELIIPPQFQIGVAGKEQHEIHEEL